MNRANWVITALVLLVGAGQVNADIIVNQPLTANPTAQYGFFTDGVNSGSGGRQEIATGFTVSADAIAVELQWWGAYRNATTPSSATIFTIRFFTDSGSLPGTLFSQQDISAMAVPTGLNNASNLPILAYDSSISAVSFTGGNTFWISILENDPSTAFANQWIWQQSDLGNVSFAGSQTDGLSWSGGPLQNTPGNMAFILSNAVPEPSSLTLLAIGAVCSLGLGWQRRKNPTPLAHFRKV
jgi:hypothetical protein